MAKLARLDVRDGGLNTTSEAMQIIQLRIESVDAAAVLSRSYGRITNPIFPSPDDPDHRRHSLFDERVFGPSRSWRCLCGKLVGRFKELRVCSVCGVRVGRSKSLRRQRFGHIQLPIRIDHPLCCGMQLSVIPVIPLAFRDCEHGFIDISFLYSQVLHACATSHLSCEVLQQRIGELFCNEWLENPVVQKGRVLRSIAGRLFSETGISLRDCGVLLFGLSLRVAPAK